MKMTTLADAPAYDSEQFVAGPLLDGSQSNVRIIRLSPGQTLPPHTHSTSDLMIYIVEGTGTLTVNADTIAFDVGWRVGSSRHAREGPGEDCGE